MQRYFIDENQIVKENNNLIITIDEADSHHIKDVMRMHVGEKVICLVKGSTKVYLSEIILISKKVILKVLEEKEQNNELPIKVTIAHGLVKRDKQEEVIRRLVELGAYAYQPVLMDRCVIKLSKTDFKFENDRLIRIVKEASEQSERNEFLHLNDVLTFDSLINTFKCYDLVLFASATSKDDLSLKDKLSLNENIKGVKKVENPIADFCIMSVWGLAHFLQ